MKDRGESFLGISVGDVLEVTQNTSSYFTQGRKYTVKAVEGYEEGGTKIFVRDDDNDLVYFAIDEEGYRNRICFAIQFTLIPSSEIDIRDFTIRDFQTMLDTALLLGDTKWAEEIYNSHFKEKEEV